MDAQSYINKITDKLKRDEFELEKDNLMGIEITSAMKNKFKLSWYNEKMNFCIVIGATRKITKADIENFSNLALDYAFKNSKGLPSAEAAGICALPLIVPILLISFNVEADAKKIIEKKPKMNLAKTRSWREFYMPVICDLKESKLYYFKKTPIWRALGYKAIKDIIEKYFL